MSNSVKIIVGDKSYDFPIVRGSKNECAINIDALRSQTGLITIDPGYKNSGSCLSEITYLNGEKGELSYRGYSIEDLTKSAGFLEVSYLLIFGFLPTKSQLEKFQIDIHKESLVDEDLKVILKSFPRSAHPMGALASLTSALTAFDPDSVDVESEDEIYSAVVNLMAKLPILCAWTYRKVKGLPLNYADRSLTFEDNIAQMFFRHPTEKYALNKLLILHADHEQNCSTSTVRIVGSSHAGLFASVSAGISALWGPLHGGANQAVIEMLEKIKNDGGDIEKYILKAKDKKDPFRLMGFGHRVYKNFDPRAKIIKRAADEVLNDLGLKDPVLEIAKSLEKLALTDEYFIKRKLYPNVDFYSGIIYRALGIPTQMFTVMFALGRLPGWIAQWWEMRKNNEPIGRPRQIFTGKTDLKFVPINKR